MKICVLVKEVPDAAVEKRINPSTGRLDRSGEKNLNPFDTHAIEAAMQLKEGGAVQVDEVVAVTMGPETAVRALHKAVSLGADRSLHLTDEALAGSDVAGAGLDATRVGAEGSQVDCGEFKAPPAKAGGTIIEDEDTPATVDQIVAWLDERKLI